MEKDIVEGKIGAVGAYDLEFKGGKLQFKVGVEKSGISADLVVGVDASAVIDAIEKAIPGQLDDVVLEILKKALVS